MKIKIKVVLPEATELKAENIVPEYATEGSVGLDLIAVSLKGIYSGTKKVHQEVIDKCTPKNYFSLRPGERALVGTGIFMEVPEGHELQIRSRSGMAWKRGLVVANSPGTIDQDYRGEIGVILLNTTAYIIRVDLGEKIAQAVLSPITKITTLDIVAELSKTTRDEGGYGSTDKQK